MKYFTLGCGRTFSLEGILVLWLGFTMANGLWAQTTNTDLSIPVAPVASAASMDNTNAIPVVVVPTNAPAAQPVPASTPPLPNAVPAPAIPSEPARTILPGASETGTDGLFAAALTTLGSLAGFLLFQSGLTRARNCGHSATLLLVGVLFAVIGYWMGGFAVQMGGVGDAHAALAESISPAGKSALDHELGFVAGSHYWGWMGSAGFFLTADAGSINGIAALFLGQTALLVIAVAAALGAGLERARIPAMAIGAFLIGALIYPLVANWVWGGGWLAGLGREFGFGHGFVDLGGAGVVHETAGALALVIAVVLGPRTGRFGREKKGRAIPGHNVPFVIIGTVVLLAVWMVTNALASDAVTATAGSAAGLATVNTLLAAAGGLLISLFLAASKKRRPAPALLCRGLLGGAVASSASCALIDPWAAFLIGLVAGLLVEGAMVFLKRRRIDDPVGAVAVHGAGGAWGVLAVGLFANGNAGGGINGVEGNVRGLFFGGAAHQLFAQIIGDVTIFAVVFLLGYITFILIQKIVGARVPLSDEAGGLDWPQTGALGYQGDE